MIRIPGMLLENRVKIETNGGDVCPSQANFNITHMSWRTQRSMKAVS